MTTSHYSASKYGERLGHESKCIGNHQDDGSSLRHLWLTCLPVRNTEVKVAAEGQSHHAGMALQYVAEQRAIVHAALGALQQEVSHLLYAASSFVQNQAIYSEHAMCRQVRLRIHTPDDCSRLNDHGIRRGLTFWEPLPLLPLPHKHSFIGRTIPMALHLLYSTDHGTSDWAPTRVCRSQEARSVKCTRPPPPVVNLPLINPIR